MAPFSPNVGFNIAIEPRNKLRFQTLIDGRDVMRRTVGPQKAKRILIIDDEPEIRAVLRELLEERHLVNTAASAEEGLRIWSDERPDLIVTDIMMPGMSGLEMVAIIRKVDRVTPIVIISGVQIIESAIKALRIGASDYLMKPFDTKMVELTVENALELGPDKLEIARLTNLNLTLEEKIEQLSMDGTRGMQNVDHSSRDVAFDRGLVHDTNNELSLIAFSLKTIRDLAADSASIQAECDHIQRYLQYIGQLLQRAKTRVGVNRLATEPVQIGELISRSASLIRARIPSGINFVSDTNPNKISGDLLVDVDQLIGVMVELTNNAVHALRNTNGEIVFDFALNGKELDIIVKNNGPEISAELREKLFVQQVQSSKEKGMGLGLVLARDTLRSLGGTINLRKSTTGWTEFVIHLPLYNPKEND